METLGPYERFLNGDELLTLIVILQGSLLTS